MTTLNKSCVRPLRARLNRKHDDVITSTDCKIINIEASGTDDWTQLNIYL
jgi:hypothetical protein